jgi:hypothetical protein
VVVTKDGTVAASTVSAQSCSYFFPTGAVLVPSAWGEPVVLDQLLVEQANAPDWTNNSNSASADSQRQLGELG